MQSWLMSQGEATAAAAGVAELLGGLSVHRVLEMARERFRCVSAASVRRDDMSNNEPNIALSALTEKCRLGTGDAFVSHSWHDHAGAKWDAFQEWREDFRKTYGREPMLWLDKYSIDQNNLGDSLACLPAYLAGCKQLLVICGNTYLERLWCLIEIMVFLEMGGDITNLDVKLLKSAETQELHKTVNAAMMFDPKNAEASTDYDTERLREVMEISGHDRISALVSRVFLPIARSLL